MIWWIQNLKERVKLEKTLNLTKTSWLDQTEFHIIIRNVWMSQRTLVIPGIPAAWSRAMIWLTLMACAPTQASHCGVPSVAEIAPITGRTGRSQMFWRNRPLALILVVNHIRLPWKVSLKQTKNGYLKLKRKNRNCVQRLCGILKIALETLRPCTWSGLAGTLLRLMRDTCDYVTGLSKYAPYRATITIVIQKVMTRAHVLSKQPYLMEPHTQKIHLR